MAPPAKRRRRDRVEDADSDYEQQRRPGIDKTLTSFVVSSPASPRNERPSIVSSNFARRDLSAATGTETSPTKTIQTKPIQTKPGRSNTTSRKVVEKDKSGQAKTADLRTLFSKQAQRTTRSSTWAGASLVIDDINSDDKDHVSELAVSSSSIVGQHARKRWRDGNQVASTEPFSISQRFLRPPNPPLRASESSQTDDAHLRPWTERFGPRNLEELVVHKKKVASVRMWLQGVMAGHSRQRLLILKGPAGSGKTATIRLLAQDMGYELVEWKTPTVKTDAGFVSTSAQFHDFLGRGGKFGTLDLDDAATCPTPASSFGRPNSRSIMLVEEFPSTFSTSSPALTSFRHSLLDYLAANDGLDRQGAAIRPVVLVISETLLTTATATADSFTAHRLLGPEMLSHEAVAVIEFNVVAPTLLARALELVVQKEARKSGRRRTPGPLVLKQLGQIGDVRSAISSLEFLCLKGDDEADWGAKVAFASKRGAQRAVGLTTSERDSLELISQREASLGIFHAVGKVVYNKRHEAPSRAVAETVPAFLARFVRPRASQVDVDALIDETGTDTHTFVAALHENYMLSCESTGPMDLSTPIDYVNESIDFLSASDVLCPWRAAAASPSSSGADAASQLLRQDELMFHAAVRGLLFALPDPVRRKPSPGRTDTFHMLYPASLKLWRAREQVDGLVHVVSTQLLRRPPPDTLLTHGASVFRRTPRPESNNAPPDPPSNRIYHDSQSKLDPASTAPPSLGFVARAELLLDRLPYMALIARARKSSSFDHDTLDKIVSFKATTSSLPHSADDDNDDNDDELAAAAQDADAILSSAWATDRPLEGTVPPRRPPYASSIVKSANAMPGLLQEKLFLSDDDIED